MNVSLTPELEAMVRGKVESGSYASASEVIREALRIMEREEKRRILIEAVNQAYDEVEQGKTLEFTRETFERMKAQAKADALAGLPVDDFVKP